MVDRMLAAVGDELASNGGTATSLLPYDATLIQLADQQRKRLAIAHSIGHEQTATLQLRPLRDVVDASAIARPLRIGYLTYDFRDHPMGHLTLGLLDAHDTSRVEIYCYSYGVNDHSEWRKRAETRCDVFRDGISLSDLAFAQQIALDEVDVVVDLMAHTTGARLGITALRPSRLGVNYLGYPGTMGSSFTDFAIVDRFVVPPEVAQSSMTERVVYLPHAYQVNEYDVDIRACSAGDDDCVRAIRRLEGLPEHAVVLCNFNTIDKMEPLSFTVWMNVLRRVPSSVLWLLEPSKTHSQRIQATLLEEAETRGIDPTRIFFAARVPKREHLARITAADLFVDSFVYNAHSTAADALWASLPIVSMWGDAFPSRVAAALVRNLVNLPELEPHSIRDFEDLAVMLAENPPFLRILRSALARYTLVAPLFDTKRIAGHIETAYEAMHDVRHRFMPPSPASARPPHFHIMVEPSTVDDLTPTKNTARLVHDAVQRAVADQQAGRFTSAQYIYERVLRTQPSHSDALHLLGVALHQLEDHDKAVEQLTRAIEMYELTPLFWYNRAIVLRHLNRHSEAEADLKAALALDPSYADAFFKLTDVMLANAEHDVLVEMYEQYAGSVLNNPKLLEHERERGYLQYSFALTKLSRMRDAVVLLESVLARSPRFFRLAYNLAAIYAALGDIRAGDERQIRTAEAEARHEFASRGLAFTKRRRPRGPPVVAFYCHEYGQSWWAEWGPSSLRTGLGGSEEAVVFLARELQRLGYWVEVYANPPPRDLSETSTPSGDGVHWYPHYAYDPNDRGVDVFIAWRYHFSLAVGTHSKRKYFWVHDLPSADTQHSRLLTELVDGILCVSDFQASLFPRQLASKLFVTSNALDAAYFVEDAANSTPARNRRFVYGSSPSRGLFELLKVWPRIRARVSGATLRVFYGFTPAFVAWGRHHIASFDVWRNETEEMLQQPGVEYVGLVDHETLAREYASAGFYLYPTTYSETSCVSLMKAMANGAIPVTSRFQSSALRETCDSFDLGPRALRASSSALEDPAWVELWVASIVRAVRLEAETADLRQRMVKFARAKYQWPRVAAQWVTLFEANSV